MTLKHAQFQQSPTMRSYVKAAQEKGWIKEEPLIKKASPNLQAAASLTENILKLCQGLHQIGASKYAKELETQFVQYKQAQTAYDVSGEKGEDLVHAAHPKGSHKLENVDSDEAVIETILDQHIKTLDKVEKMPTGKLSTSAEIIAAVKVVLAQSYDDVRNLLQSAYANAYKAYNVAKTAGKLSGAIVFAQEGNLSDMSDIVKKPSESVSLSDINKATASIKLMRGAFEPHFRGWAGIQDPDVWRTVDSYLTAATKNLESAAEMIKRLVVIPMKPESIREPTVTIKPVTVGGPIDDILTGISDLIKDLESYKLLGLVTRNPAAMGWIQKEQEELKDFMNRANQVEAARAEMMAPELQRELETHRGWVAQFSGAYMKGGK